MTIVFTISYFKVDWEGKGEEHDVLLQQRDKQALMKTSLFLKMWTG